MEALDDRSRISQDFTDGSRELHGQRSEAVDLASVDTVRHIDVALLKLLNKERAFVDHRVALTVNHMYLENTSGDTQRHREWCA